MAGAIRREGDRRPDLPEFRRLFEDFDLDAEPPERDGERQTADPPSRDRHSKPGGIHTRRPRARDVSRASFPRCRPARNSIGGLAANCPRLSSVARSSVEISSKSPRPPSSGHLRRRLPSTSIPHPRGSLSRKHTTPCETSQARDPPRPSPEPPATIQTLRHERFFHLTEGSVRGNISFAADVSFGEGKGVPWSISPTRLGTASSESG